MSHAYGWRPDRPDFRDHVFSAPRRLALPSRVDMRAACSPVIDQGALGSCTGCAIAGAYAMQRMKQTGGDFEPSVLFIYYNERVIEGTVEYDAGAEIRDGIKTVAKAGVCRTEFWPYDISMFAREPPPQSYVEASKTPVIKYRRIVRYESKSYNLSAIRTCLAEGFPVIFGFTVYESFESRAVASTGDVPMPLSTERPIGGHAVIAVGYDDAIKRVHVRNSWGKTWGDAGYFTMPYAYVSHPRLAADFWSIRLVAEGDLDGGDAFG